MRHTLSNWAIVAWHAKNCQDFLTLWNRVCEMLMLKRESLSASIESQKRMTPSI